MSKRFTIGLDPGTHTGFAVYDRAIHKITLALTLDFTRTLALLDSSYPPSICDIVMEDASLNKPTFRHNPNDRKMDRMCRNIGMIQKECKLLLAQLRARGYVVQRVRPSRNDHKWDRETVKRYTGYYKKTSSHARDAIRMCWGVKVVREELAA